MKRKNATRNALFTSIMSLLLCVSMLVGTTFAWFTDSVVSGNNQIIAGNLDIDVMYANTPDGTYTSIENVPDLFVAPSGATKGLWEPGHTEVAYLKVVNNGTLALKYQFKVDAASEVIGKSVLGDDIKLSEILKFAATDPADAAPAEYTRASAQAAAETSGSNLLGYTTSTKTLAPGASQYITLVVYMPETTGNEANYRGNAVPAINFKLTALATQVEAEAENDSFGDDYDADAIYTDVVVTNETELKDALANINDGAIIGIRGNVTWTTGASIGSTPFIEAATTYALRATQEVKNITLVGMDETATFTAIGQGVGAIGIDGGTVTFKNLKIVDESVSYDENSWEYGYLEFRGNTVFEDCNIVNAIMMEGDSASFTNCFFNSNDDNQYAVWVSNGDASFENCYITGTRGIKIHEAYGSKVGTVVINKNEFVDLTKKPGLAIGDVDADTTVVLTNNKFIGTQAGDQGLYSYETDTEVTTFNFTYEGNTFAGYADNNTELKEAIQNNATIVLPEGEYTLPTLSDKEGITIIGAADGSTVIGGENASTGFGGSNFGKNTTIQNVNFSGTTNGVRSSYAQGGTTTFDNCTFAGGSTYGFHMDQSNGATLIFNYCTFSGFNAFAGDLVKVVFNNCTFLNNGNYGHTNIWSVAEFNNCTFGDKTSVGPGKNSGVKIYFNDVEESYHHEFVGTAESLFAFADSVNNGGNAWKGQKVVLVDNIDLNNQAWTPIGQTGATQFQGTFDGNGYTIKNLNIDSSAQTGAHYSSGLFGWLNMAVVKNLTIENATVTGNHNVAVIAGYLESAGCTISECHVINAAVVAKHANGDACGDKVGVIVGHAGNAGVKVENCSATDCHVVAGRDAGQIAGAAKAVNVVDCTATNVTVTAGSDCTGANIKNEVIGRVL